MIHIHSFNQHDSLDGLYVFHGTTLDAEVICNIISVVLALIPLRTTSVFDVSNQTHQRLDEMRQVRKYRYRWPCLMLSQGK